ncbi:hypothetical protein DJ568_09365 [Mucilaginibacter hurinus]|uniref:Uncharacterized protein YyaB-like PH domain-containing protein n=1 Tax=Mucilaginibacter hurinus TaxID=2201324 RepID=A0A367GR89_9SPHI|nr:PH domain-containing protein [Mucilaginibacter hurinus]RCH55376.1 hypothetical protein DJ568_09365 [Mucilaginibacter hurinus]
MLQNRVFRSKTGFVVWVPIALCCGIAVLAWYTDNLVLFPVLIIGFGLLLTLWLLNTSYSITADGLLKIRCFVLRIDIPIHVITKINKSKSITSAAALSSDRLEVWYNRYDSVIISPKAKDIFIAALKEVNPAIKVNL